MKAKLIFKLPKDQDRYLQAVHSEAMAFVLWEFLHNAHRPYKYDDQDGSFFDGFRKAQQLLGEALYEHGVDINNLTE